MSCLIRSLLVAEHNRRPDAATDELLPWLMEAAIKETSAAPPQRQLVLPSPVLPDPATLATKTEVQSPVASSVVDLAAVLLDASMPADALQGATLAECEARLLEDRPSFLAWLAMRGIADIKQRQKLANLLQRHRRALNAGNVAAADTTRG